jgi:hypothetical protein
MSDVKDLLRRITKGDDELYSKVGKVISIDEAKRTCKVELVDGSAPVFSVRMQASISFEKGVFLKPVIGSDVLVSFLNKDFAFISLTSELDQVLVFSDDVQLGGKDGQAAVRGEDLNDNLKQLNSNIGSLVSLLDTFMNTQQAVSLGPLAPLKPAYLAAISSMASVKTGLENWAQKLDDHLSEKVKVL